MSDVIHLGSASERWPDSGRGPWVVTFHWALIEGEAECIGIDIRSFREGKDGKRILINRTDGPARLTSRLLRDLPFTVLRRASRQSLRDLQGHVASARDVSRRVREVAAFGERALGIAPKKARGRPRVSMTDLAKVAEAYELAIREGRLDPTRAVAEAVYNTAKSEKVPSVAYKWVMEARRRGLITSAAPHRKRSR